jgi:L-ectoine synthase
MLVRNLPEAAKGVRRIESSTWNSVRLLLKGDGVGFSFHITTIYADTVTEMHYKNHFEAVYCISGEGEIESLADGRVFAVEPGTLYVLDRHDAHRLRAHTELQLACVFNPPLHGNEVHDASGAYPLEAEAISNQVA